MVDGFQDCVFSSGHEKDAIDFLVFCADFLGNMPRDRFTLSVRVGARKMCATFFAAFFNSDRVFFLARSPGKWVKNRVQCQCPGRSWGDL